ncbi:unnamed protein product [Zymoseptoria tritici ST99CH_3D1]|nr:unnamed protein product [Zymoseptoria tritici ST99CH_3D1]
MSQSSTPDDKHERLPASANNSNVRRAASETEPRPNGGRQDRPQNMGTTTGPPNSTVKRRRTSVDESDSKRARPNNFDHETRYNQPAHHNSVSKPATDSYRPDYVLSHGETPTNQSQSFAISHNRPIRQPLGRRGRYGPPPRSGQNPYNPPSRLARTEGDESMMPPPPPQAARANGAAAGPSRSRPVTGHQEDWKLKKDSDDWAHGDVFWGSHNAMAYDVKADPAKNSKFVQTPTGVVSSKHRMFLYWFSTKDVGMQSFAIGTGTGGGVAGQPQWKRRFLIPLVEEGSDKIQTEHHASVEVKMKEEEKGTLAPGAFIDISKSWPHGLFEKTRMVGRVPDSQADRVISAHREVIRRGEVSAKRQLIQREADENPRGAAHRR